MLRPGCMYDILWTSLDTHVPTMGYTLQLSPTPPLNIPPPSTAASRTSNIRATRLQMLQNLRRIVAVHIERILIRRVPPSNLLDHVVRIRLANDGHLGGEPLLEGLCDEVAVCGEPAGHGCADVDGLGERGAGGCEDDVALVDGDVLLGVGGYADLHSWLVPSVYANHNCVGLTHPSSLALSLIHNSLLHKPQPVREGAVQDEVSHDRGQGVGFRGVPAKLPVKVE
jgi:hypothetical protein